MDGAGRAVYHAAVKQLMNTKHPDQKLIEQLQNTGRTTRGKKKIDFK